MTITFALVVPTKGDRPYLPSIVGNAGCPVYLINTSGQSLTEPGARVIRDDGPVNIQRWWNVGIDASGADHVALFNDDVTYPPGLIQAMTAELSRTGAAICFTEPAGITGWAFMIDARRVRPDERFAWYHGDNDLHQQALHAGGVARVAVPTHHHHPGESTQRDQSLQRAAAEDAAAYRRKWP